MVMQSVNPATEEIIATFPHATEADIPLAVDAAKDGFKEWRPYSWVKRAKIMREIKVLTAQGRLSGYVLTSLPFLVALVMWVFNRKYFEPLIMSSTGRYMLAYALVSILLGNIVIRRLVKIEV